MVAAECRPTDRGLRRPPNGGCLEVVRLDVPKGSAANPFAFQLLAPSHHFELAQAPGSVTYAPSPFEGAEGTAARRGPGAKTDGAEKTKGEGPSGYPTTPWRSIPDQGTGHEPYD